MVLGDNIFYGNGFGTILREFVITSAVHGDSRGYFMETYSQRDIEKAELNVVFVQDN